MKKINIAQRIVNSFPEDASIRDSQSVGFGFVNCLMEPLQDAFDDIERQKSNLFLSTFDNNSLDVTYVSQLPESLNLFDQTLVNRPYFDIQVSGELASGFIELTEVDQLKDLTEWSLPTRITYGEELPITAVDIDAIVYDAELEITPPRRLYLTVESEDSRSFWLDEENQVVIPVIYVAGYNESNQWVKEEIAVTEWKTYQTRNTYKEIYAIQTFFFQTEPTVTLNKTDREKYSFGWYDKDSRTLPETKVEITNHLVEIKINKSNFQNRVQGLSTFETVSSFSLSTDRSVRDFLPTDKGIWVLTSGELSFYDLQEDFLGSQATGSRAIIETYQNTFGLSQDIPLDFLLLRQDLKVLNTVLTMQVDNDTPVWLENDGSTSSTLVKVVPNGRQLRDSLTLSLDEPGIISLTLTVNYEQGITEQITRKIKVDERSPMFSQSIDDSFLYLQKAKDKLIAFNEDNYISINQHRDVFLLDRTNKQLFTKEQYLSLFFEV